MSHLHPNRAEADQVFQRYQDRAIREINALNHEVEACGRCEHDSEARALGTGHPLADIMLVKWASAERELDEGVAFHGRAGEAMLASARRLGIDPLDLYGTNCIKCAPRPTSCMRERCPSWLLREVRIVQPKVLIVMGHETLRAVNELGVDDASELQARVGEVQRWTHTCEAIWCPDIDESLDRPASKHEFWQAFRTLGDWYADRPPW